jgi:hypothetical protein
MRLSNLPFKLESSVARGLMRALALRPSSAPFLSGDSFRALAHHVYENGALKNVRPVGGHGVHPVVFVTSSEARDFFQRGCGGMNRPFVLVTNNGDENIGCEHLEMLDRRVVHWFAHNLLAHHERATGIPMGLENARLHCNGIVRDFVILRQQLASIDKVPRVLSGFTVGNNFEERSMALSALRGCSVATHLERVNGREYRQRLAAHMFVASPPGNGFDCHRTWEALYLHVVPVVRRNPFFDQFPGLPLLQLNEWRDLESYSERELADYYASVAAGFNTLPMLWLDYWQTRIENSSCEGTS